MTSAINNEVQYLMATPVLTVDPAATLREAAMILRDERIGTLAVMGADGLIGVRSERDVTRAIADRADPDEVWVADILAEEPVSARPDDSLVDCLLLMVGAGVRHLPVVAEGRVVGMFSMRDGVDALVGDISERFSSDEGEW